MKTGLVDWLLETEEDHTQNSGPPPDAEVARVEPRAPEQNLFDRFRNAGEIGRGGMASVHRVFDRNLLRYTAMKVIDPRFAERPVEAQRFIEEAQIMAQLDHPNIVPVHELGADEAGTLYFTMKQVIGRTLSAELREWEKEGIGTPGRISHFLEIFTKICDAIAFAHSRGVIHRDLKPGNIMVGSFGQVYVMDWGLARLIQGRGALEEQIQIARNPSHQELDSDGLVMGSFRYMSPEQAQGHSTTLDKRTDVFSLGALLYHMLAGRPPYPATDVPHAILQAQACDITRPDEVVPEGVVLPPGLCQVAMRALAKNPDHRYQTVTSLKSDVELYLRGGFHLPTRMFWAGSLVVEQGEPGNAAYIITQGRCQAFKTIDGEKVVLRQMGPGDVFGETAVLSLTPRSASVEALEDLSVVEVTAQALKEGVGMNSWLGAFVRALAQRFVECDERLARLEMSYLSSGPRDGQ